MDSVDEAGVAREGLQRDCLMAREECCDSVLLHIQAGELEPRQRVFYEIRLHTVHSAVTLRGIGNHSDREGSPCTKPSRS